jgi:multiple sugar transport system substrate-binding protein
MALPFRPSRRHLLATLSAGAAVGILAACGGTASTPPATGQASATTGGSTAATAAAKGTTTASQAAAAGATPIPSALIQGSKATTTLEVWDWATTWQQLLTKLAQDYVAQAPTYKIHLQIPPNYYTKLQVAFAGGTGPDVYRTDSPDAFSLAYRNVLLPLDSYLGKDQAAKANFDATVKQSQEASTYKGKIIGVPFGGTLVLTIYNEDLLKDSGLTPPADLGAAWDWNKVAEYGQKLTQKGSGPRPAVYGFFADTNWETGWLPAVIANGGNVLDPATNYQKCLLTQPQAIEAMQWMVDLVLKDKVSPSSADLSSQSGSSLFFTGKIAIATFGSWQIPQARQAKINFNIAAVPYAPKTGKTGSDSNFALVGVNPTSKVKDDGVQYALWINTLDAQKTIGSFEYMPANPTAADATYFTPSLGPANRGVLKNILAITTPEPSPDVVTFTDVINVVQQELPVIFQGNETVTTGLTKVSQQIDARIQTAVKAG